MKKDNYWDFIKVNFVSLATVFAGVLALILQRLGVLDESRILSAILFLVILLATTELVDKSRKLDRLEHSIAEIYDRSQKLTNLELLLSDGFRNTLQAVGGATIKKYRLVDDGWDYVALKIRDAQSTIDHAGLAPPTPRWSRQATNYLDAILEVLKSNRVKYRYIAGLSEEQKRLDRVVERLSHPEIKQYFPAYYPQPPGIAPAFSFIIFDRKEVVVYYPGEAGEEEFMMSIKQPDLEQMYYDYFRGLWANAQKLTLERARLLEQQINRSNISALSNNTPSRDNG